MGVENKDSCSQRDSAEREGNVRAHRSFRRIWKERDSVQPELLEEILKKDNLNRAFKRVKANKGAPGIDGITVEEIGAYLRENQKGLIERIRRGKYAPRPGETSGDSQARRWNTKAWYSNRKRPHFPTSHNTASYTGIRTAVLGEQLRLSPGKRCKRCHTKGKGVCRAGIYPCGSIGLIKIFRHPES